MLLTGSDNIGLIVGVVVGVIVGVLIIAAVVVVVVLLRRRRKRFDHNSVCVDHHTQLWCSEQNTQCCLLLSALSRTKDFHPSLKPVPVAPETIAAGRKMRLPREDVEIIKGKGRHEASREGLGLCGKRASSLSDGCVCTYVCMYKNLCFAQQLTV